MASFSIQVRTSLHVLPNGFDISLQGSCMEAYTGALTPQTGNSVRSKTASSAVVMVLILLLERYSLTHDGLRGAHHSAAETGFPIMAYGKRNANV